MTALRHDLTVKMRPISEVRPWADNPRDNDAAAERLATTILTHGWTNPILLDRTGMVVAGHTRLKAAMKIGLAEVPTITLDAEGQDAIAIAIADNRLAEFAEWDDPALSKLLQGLAADDYDLDALGYDADEFAELLDSLEPEEPAGPDDGEVTEPPEEPDSRQGEVYELGPHRLVCGDCRDASVWDSLLGGELLDMAWTDPPYGVAYVGKTADAMTIENDEKDEAALSALLVSAFSSLLDRSKPGAVWYVAATPGPMLLPFGEALKRLGVWRHTLVWRKDRFVMGFADYHYAFELVFYGWTPGAPHYFINDRTQDNVHECPRPGSNKKHPTMKPVPLLERHITNSSRAGWLVGDPFGGSGSTLIACARTGRIAALVELDPGYCDVIRRRWTTWADEAGVDAGPGALR